MITLKEETAELIRLEMESIPEKYQKPFNSTHEGLAVLREEYIELENEIFFGEKQYLQMAKESGFTEYDCRDVARINHLISVKQEAIQVAAMAARIIQELT